MIAITATPPTTIPIIAAVDKPPGLLDCVGVFVVVYRSMVLVADGLLLIFEVVDTLVL